MFKYLLFSALVALAALASPAEASGYWNNFISEVTPPFSQSLNKLSTLLGLMVVHEESDFDENRYKNGPIQSALAETNSALETSKSVAERHKSAYESNVQNLNSQRSTYENNINYYNNQIDSYNSEISRLSDVINNLQNEVNRLNSLYENSNAAVAQAERDLEKRRKCRLHWIAITVFVPVAGIGIITNENELNNAKDQRNNWQRARDNNQAALNSARWQYGSVVSNRNDVERQLAGARSNLASTSNALVELRNEMATVVAFGEKIKNANTFVTTFSGRVNVIHTQNKVVFMFELMLNSLDDLLNFLANNLPNISVMATRQAVQALRTYL